MADSSFDVVSKLDRQEVDNAVNQTAKEIANRYDFRGVDAAISLSGATIAMEANSASRVMAILDVLQSDGRSEERRVGKECRSRWSPYH